MDAWEDFLNELDDPEPYVFSEEESVNKLRAKLSDMQKGHQRELIETGYGQYPRHMHKSVQEAFDQLDERRMEVAQAESKAGWVNPSVDSFCCPTPGYVPPTIKRSGCGLLALIIPTLLILSQVVV